jgi:hypothetical protein
MDLRGVQITDHAFRAIRGAATRRRPAQRLTARGSWKLIGACEGSFLPLPTIGNKAETNDANQQHGPAGRQWGSGNTGPGSVVKSKPFAATHRLIRPH